MGHTALHLALLVAAVTAELCTEPGAGEWVSTVCVSSGTGNPTERVVLKQTTIEDCTVIALPSIKAGCVAGASNLLGKDTGAVPPRLPPTISFVF
jgi:hypothetical protein